MVSSPYYILSFVELDAAVAWMQTVWRLEFGVARYGGLKWDKGFVLLLLPSSSRNVFLDFGKGNELQLIVLGERWIGP